MWFYLYMVIKYQDSAMFIFQEYVLLECKIPNKLNIKNKFIIYTENLKGKMTGN